ncbi:MAG: prepilin-type N-terminal cleavage/methylation domain-containing protein [Syntrophales bacterium]
MVLIEKKNHKGFTLLELLIAIILTAVIVAIVGISMGLACRSIETGEKRMGRLERFRVSWMILNDQIGSMMPLSYTIESEKKLYFKGSRSSLQISTNQSIWHGQQGYVLVKYVVESDKTLKASENFIGVDNIREATLFENVEEMAFQYYFTDHDGTGQWLDEWVEDRYIPEKTKINMTFEGKKYSMIIPIRSFGSKALPVSTSVAPDV